MEKIDTRVLMSAIDINGVDYNVDKAIEEMAELTKALLKMKYNAGQDRGKVNQVVTEIADVYIIVHVLTLMFDPDIVGREVDYKMQRLSQILIEKNGNKEAENHT